MGTETRESLQDFTSLPSFEISRFLTSTSSNNATTSTSTASSTTAVISILTSLTESPSLSTQPVGGAPTTPATTSPPNSSGTPSGSAPFSTGLTVGEKAGIGIGSAVVLALFLWWLWPKKWTAKAKLKMNAPTHILPDAQQSAVTEVKETVGKHLSNNRVKTV